MKESEVFKLTYATMFDPPPELHTLFDEKLVHMKANLGQEQPMLINGEDRFAQEKFESISPINTDWVLGTFQKGTQRDVNDALDAAQTSFSDWSRLNWQERVALLRKVATQIEARLFELGVALSLEVGKNRLEALGDAQETADLIRHACDMVESNNGFIVQMENDPLKGFISTNVSLLKPYGVWVVISPFNFPCALTGGPAGAALVAGNTVVAKSATDTPWVGRLLAECFRDAGLPDGVFNYITGPGNEVGKGLVEDPRVAGITFTGSYDVGMNIYRSFAQGHYPRPTILEMGGKNPAIVSRNADLDQAATGIVRAAYGLQGQKCSACSRVIAETTIKAELAERIAQLAQEIEVGDPTAQENWMGPVINRGSYGEFSELAEELSQAGTIIAGGTHLIEGDLANGYFCAPTVVDGVPKNHRLWQHEMFLPITMITDVASLDEAMAMANDVDYGLTAGFYGSESEAQWFFDNIESGVNYANRSQGATTGAWPGFQPFGGWKGSGSSGKFAGGPYYVTNYMHEQSQTVVKSTL